jgi:hypothetical protein
MARPAMQRPGTQPPLQNNQGMAGRQSWLLTSMASLHAATMNMMMETMTGGYLEWPTKGP